MWVDNYKGLACFLGTAGKVSGRKKLQKVVYLAQEMGFPGLKESFDYHWYGPYSEALASKVSELQLLGAVQEAESNTRRGYPTYSYQLTEPGREHFAEDLEGLSAYKGAVDRLLKPSARFLELAATLHFFLQNGYDFSTAAKETQARKSEQGYSDEECREALEFLNGLRSSFTQVVSSL